MLTIVKIESVTMMKIIRIIKKILIKRKIVKLEIIAIIAK